MVTKSNENSIQTTNTDMPYWELGLEDDRLAHLVRQLSRSFRRSLEFRLSEHNISFGHWTFLRILWQEEGISQKELSTRAGVKEPTTHTAILKMEALGYLERRHGDGNRKALLVFLSEKGRELETVLVPLAEAVNKKAVDGLQQQDLKLLRTCLLKMMTNLIDDENQALTSGQRINPTQSQVHVPSQLRHRQK